MAEQLSPHERHLLDALQAEDSPSPGEQQRVKQRLFAQLGLGVAATASGALVGSATQSAAAQSAAAQSSSLASQAANLSHAATAAGQLGSGAAAGSAGSAGASAAASSLGWASLALTKLGTTKAIVGVSLALATAGGAVALLSHDSEPLAVNGGESVLEAVVSAPDTAPRAVVEVPATEQPLLAPVPTEVRQPAPLAPPAKRPPALVSRPSALQEEAALLGQAQQAIAAGQGTRAMALLLEHQTRFPSGTLRVERQAALAIARCQSGQWTQGRKEAERFRRAHPQSPMLQRLETACQLEPR